MAKNTFMMLAQKYKPTKHAVGGWYMSEKLDGQRAYWDGGISRGVVKSLVPWANCEKDARYQVQPIATGLWSRYGNVIHCPDTFLDQLPPYPLDGELYVTQDRQRLRSIIAKLEPCAISWQAVRYMVFDKPMLPCDGIVKLTNFKKDIVGCDAFIAERGGERGRKMSFEATYKWLGERLPTDGIISLLEQVPLPLRDFTPIIDAALNEITSSGGEGLILRDPYSFWKAERVHELLKVKKLDDMEGTVIGYTTGRKTALGSKLLGMMGALILDIGGKRLELSGFTEAEWLLGYTDDHCHGAYGESVARGPAASEWATEHPEAECPTHIEAMAFPRGMKVTFRYRGLSNDGIPNEARYWRGYDAV